MFLTHTQQQQIAYILPYSLRRFITMRKICVKKYTYLPPKLNSLEGEREKERRGRPGQGRPRGEAERKNERGREGRARKEGPTPDNKLETQGKNPSPCTQSWQWWLVTPRPPFGLTPPHDRSQPKGDTQTMGSPTVQAN